MLRVFEELSTLLPETRHGDIVESEPNLEDVFVSATRGREATSKQEAA